MAVVVAMAAPLLRAQTPATVRLGASTEHASTAAEASARAAVAKQTPIFIENRGQWDRRAKFLLRSPGLDLWITNDGVIYDLSRVEKIEENSNNVGPRLASSQLRIERAPVYVTFEGANQASSAVGSGQLAEYHNYYIGNDPSRWAERVPLYSDARVNNLYAGVDAIFYLDEGRPRYDLVVKAGADPSTISMRIEGASKVEVVPGGALRIETSLGTVEQRELFAYQEIDGAKQQVACAFVAGRDGRVRFEVGSYDRSRALVIDPLVYSTYLGGGSYDEARDIAVDGSGNAYVTGLTTSTNFPTVNASQSSYGGVVDAFVTKLSSSGARPYSTYLGGSSNDQGWGIAVDGSGNAYVTGRTFSSNFPTVNASQSSNAGGWDGFVMKLSGTGTRNYSTYLGGSSGDYGWGIAVDGSGNAYVTGYTTSTNFPTINASQSSFGGTEDAFVTKLSSTGARSYSTYLGGSSFEEAWGIAVDSGGNAYVTGYTYSTNFPTVNASQSSIAGVNDAFVTKLGSDGTRSYSTYLGGSLDDLGDGIAVDGDGNVYITGYTTSTNFPTLNASQSSRAGGFDAFVTKLSSTGTREYSTYLGGSSDDFARGIAVDGSGNAHVTGYTASTNFPTLNASQSSYSGAYDTFVTKFDSSATREYSTYLGGNSFDYGFGIAVDGSTNAYVAGFTTSTDFPTVNASQSSLSLGGSSDAFVTKISGTATIALTAPATGATWCAGTTQSITWTSTGITNVAIEISTDGGSSWSPIVASTSASTGSYSWAIPANQAANTSYRVKLSDATNGAVNDASDGNFTINTPPAVTDAPDAVGTTAFAPGGVSFTAASSGVPAPGVQWELSTDDGASWSPIGGATSATFSIAQNDLTTELDGNLYRAVFSNSCSSATTTAALLGVAKAATTLTLSDLSYTYDAAAHVATATPGVSGLDVDITYAQNGSPVAAPTAAGSYDVVAAIDDANYEGAVTGTLVIDRATLQVTAQNETKEYGAANPPLSYSMSGFVAGEGSSEVVGGAAITTTATTASQVGSYPITVTQGTLDAANYQFEFNSATLEVTPKGLTVTADDATRSYGASNPAFAAHYQGFVNDDDAADLDGILDLVTAATTGSPVGTYAVTPSGQSSMNYAITFVDGELEITPAPLTVTADDKSKTCGDANPALTGTIDGILNGDDITATFSTTATTASGAGVYDIVPVASGAKLSNYAVTYDNGTLTVNAPAITSHPADQDVVAGNTASFSASVSGTATVQWQVSADAGASWSNIDGATSTSYSLTTAVTQSGTQYRAVFDNGTCTTATDAATLTVKVRASDLGPAVVFLGTTDANDNNREIDVKVELYRNSTLISSGELARERISGTNQNGSRKYTVPLTMTNGAVDFGPSDELHVRVYARRNGGSDDFDGRIWYNDNPSQSVNQGNRGWARVGNETAGGTNTGYFYLRSSSALNTSAGSDGESITRTLGTSWELFDAWTMSGSSMKPATGAAITGVLTARVVPNPVGKAESHLELGGITADVASISVVDATGRPVLVLPSVHVISSGVVRLPMSFAELASGNYTLRVVAGSSTVTTAFSVVR